MTGVGDKQRPGDAGRMNETGAPPVLVRSATPGDLGAILDCLDEAQLGSGDVAEHLADFLVAERGGVILGTIGMELYGERALLRSAAVSSEHRSEGIGHRLVEELERRAAGMGVREIFLLTTTAEKYFARRGYRVVNREDVGGAILRSGQFQGACPASAAIMRKELERRF